MFQFLKRLFRSKAQSNFSDTSATFHSSNLSVHDNKGAAVSEFDGDSGKFGGGGSDASWDSGNSGSDSGDSSGGDGGGGGD